MSDKYYCIVNGESVGGPDFSANVNPADTSDIIGLYAEADNATAAAAVTAAREAFPRWSRASPQVRSDVLNTTASLLFERRAELGRLLAREEGKTLNEAVGEVVRASHIFRYFAGEAVRMSGETVPSVRAGVDVEITREPVGVFALITPWNFPIAIPAWKTAPALAFGNTVVLKPAELTPGCAHALALILLEAGAPAGVFNLVMGPGSKIGAALVNDPKVSGVSFTGSVPTGRSIAASRAAEGRRVQCEMGGKNAMVVLDDADLSVAVEACVNGAFFSTGQRCTASSRLIVHERVHDAFVAAVLARMDTLRVGDPLEPTTDIGPVVDARQLAQNLRYLDIAREEGAVVHGGQRLTMDKEGFYMRPALLAQTSPDMRVNNEEIFGPIASVIRVSDDDEALEVANGVPFGLSAGVCTTSLARARRFKRDLAAGMVMVNLPTAGVDYHVPFGGTKDSSFGPREQGSYARDFYTLVKTCYTG